MKKIIAYINFEAAVWSASLLFLSIINPSDINNLSICPLHNIGFKYCPGCGLGASLSYLLRGDFAASFNAHYLGGAAAAILIYRIIKLSIYQIKKNNGAKYA